MTEEDLAWKADWRERYLDIEVRVDRFLAWLVQRPQNHVAVVSHGVWMETLFRKHDPLVLGDEKRVQNCDVFLCRIVSRDGVFARIESTQHISGRER